MERNFYGHEKVNDIKAVNDEYKGIVTPLDLYDRLLSVWCRETCAPRMRDAWSEANKTLGQCSITAFLAQDIFGGEVYAVMTENGNLHCFNYVDNVMFDLTSEQFLDKAALLKYDLSMPQNREMPGHFGKTEKKERYEYLVRKLREGLKEV